MTKRCELGFACSLCERRKWVKNLIIVCFHKVICHLTISPGMPGGPWGIKQQILFSRSIKKWTSRSEVWVPLNQVTRWPAEPGGPVLPGRPGKPGIPSVPGAPCYIKEPWSTFGKLNEWKPQQLQQVYEIRKQHKWNESDDGSGPVYWTREPSMGRLLKLTRGTSIRNR